MVSLKETIKKNKVEILLVCFLLILILIFWGRYFSYIPFGDVDASPHFAMSDYQYVFDKVTVSELPLHIKNVYGFANDGKLWYPPHFHLLAAVFQFFDRFYGIYTFYFLGSILFIFTYYLVWRKLFGWEFAFFAGLLSVFSIRDFIAFGWGLWPERVSFAFVPLILYCVYKNERNYLLLLPLLVTTQFVMHPFGVVHSFIYVMLYYLFMLFKNGFKYFKVGWLFLSLIILLVLLSPFVGGPFSSLKNYNQNLAGDSFRIQELDSLLHWYPENVPYAPTLGQYRYVYGSFIFIPLIILGLLFLLLKRSDAHLLLLTQVVGIYILMHLNVIGYTSRIHRSMNAESHAVIPLIVVGFLLLYDFFKEKKWSKYWKVGLAIIFVVFLVFNYYDKFNDFSDRITRSFITPSFEEIEATDWIMNNVPEDSYVRYVGVVVYKKVKWLSFLSHRTGVYDDVSIDGSKSEFIGLEDYLFVDFRDLIYLQNKEGLEYLVNLTEIYGGKLVYDYQGVKIYDLANR